MTAPTEAEIRAAVVHSMPADFSIDDIRNWFETILDSDKALVRAGWMDEFYARDSRSRLVRPEESTATGGPSR